MNDSTLKLLTFDPDDDMVRIIDAMDAALAEIQAERIPTTMEMACQLVQVSFDRVQQERELDELRGSVYLPDEVE